MNQVVENQRWYMNGIVEKREMELEKNELGQYTIELDVNRKNYEVWKTKLEKAACLYPGDLFFFETTQQQRMKKCNESIIQLEIQFSN